MPGRRDIQPCCGGSLGLKINYKAHHRFVDISRNCLMESNPNALKWHLMYNRKIICPKSVQNHPNSKLHKIIFNISQAHTLQIHSNLTSKPCSWRSFTASSPQTAKLLGTAAATPADFRTAGMGGAGVMPQKTTSQGPLLDVFGCRTSRALMDLDGLWMHIGPIECRMYVAKWCNSSIVQEPVRKCGRIIPFQYQWCCTLHTDWCFRLSKLNL